MRLPETPDPGPDPDLGPNPDPDTDLGPNLTLTLTLTLTLALILAVTTALVTYKTIQKNMQTGVCMCYSFTNLLSPPAAMET